jgi:ATP-dependent RNA helicase RhlE
MLFSELMLIEPLCRALAAEGYSEPTPIQQKAIPDVLAGRDLLGCAQTGTGKTAAFALPLLQRLAAEKKDPRIRALILAPTRELAAQIGERIYAYGRHLGLRHTVVFGGVSQFHQARALRPTPPPIVVATPGRLLDLCNQRLIDLSKVEILVLDEADRMLDMGFIHDVKKVVAMTPKTRQTLFFSATMPPDIVALVKTILTDPVRVDVAPTLKTAERVEQSVFHVSRTEKRNLLERLLRDPAIERVLVFTRTKRGASRVAEQLDRAGIAADAIHGDKTQGARERALNAFRRGHTRVLVATDIAARGIDVDGVSHVVNYDLPHVPESYVHRIGRTGRAGASGIAFSFCDPEERSMLVGIERLIGKRLPIAERPPALPPGEASAAPAPATDAYARERPASDGAGRDANRDANRDRGPRPRSDAPPRDNGPSFAPRDNRQHPNNGSRGGYSNDRQSSYSNDGPRNRDGGPPRSFSNAGPPRSDNRGYGGPPRGESRGYGGPPRDARPRDEAPRNARPSAPPPAGSPRSDGDRRPQRAEGYGFAPNAGSWKHAELRASVPAERAPGAAIPVNPTRPVTPPSEDRSGSPDLGRRRRRRTRYAGPPGN